MSGNANSYPPTSTKETLNSADSFDGQSRPEHHLHRESEPLPGSDSVASSQDQSKDSLRENRQDTGVTGIRQRTPDFEDSSFGQNALNSERPLNVEPANQGGVAIDEREGLPEGHANVADKMIGKVQKVTGKYMNKPELHEKGELRESGGKLAVTGEARVPRD